MEVLLFQSHRLTFSFLAMALISIMQRVPIPSTGGKGPVGRGLWLGEKMEWEVVREVKEQGYNAWIPASANVCSVIWGRSQDKSKFIDGP